MNILVLALNYSPELVGCAKFTTEFVDWLSQKKNNIIVITTNPFYPEWECKNNKYNRSIKKNILIIRCPIFIPKKINGLNRILHYLSFFITSLPLVIFYGLRKVDLAFTMCPTILSAPSIFIASFIKKCFFNKRLFTWIHYADLEIEAAFQLKLFNNKFLKKFLLFFEKSILNKADLISAISFFMIDKITNKIGNKNKIFYLPDFIDSSQFSTITNSRKSNPYYEDLSLEDNKIIIMYSGTLNEKLASDTIVEAIKILANHENLLWIISGNGPKKQYLINKLSNFDNVRFYDFQPFCKLPNWLNIADIHLVPQKLSSVKYCMPSKLLGILATGKPVIGIAPKDSDLGKILDKFGIRLSDEDPKKMSEGLLKLIKNKKLRSELGEKGKKYIRKYHEKDNVLNNILIALKKIYSNTDKREI